MNGWSPHNKTYLEIFVHFLPFAWLQNVLLAMTNEGMESGNSPPLSLGELMRYLGMRLLMSTLQGGLQSSSKRDMPIASGKLPCRPTALLRPPLRTTKGK